MDPRLWRCLHRTGFIWVKDLEWWWNQEAPLCTDQTYAFVDDFLEEAIKSSSIHEEDEDENEDVDYEYLSSNHNAHATLSTSNSLQQKWMNPSKYYMNLVIWYRPRVNNLHYLCLSLHFLLPAPSSFTSFLPVSSSCIFGYSLLLEVSIRKLKLSSSIVAVLQDFSGFNCLLRFFFDFKFNGCFFGVFILLSKSNYLA
jgi:hypothetical protein